MFLFCSVSDRSYSNSSCSNSFLGPNTVSSKNWTDSDALISGLFVVANERVLNDPIAVGVPTSLLVLI